MWFGEFDPEDKGLYQKVCLWLTDRWEMMLYFKYNWRRDLKSYLIHRRLRKITKKLRKRDLL